MALHATIWTYQFLAHFPSLNKTHFLFLEGRMKQKGLSLTVLIFSQEKTQAAASKVGPKTCGWFINPQAVWCTRNCSLSTWLKSRGWAVPVKPAEGLILLEPKCLAPLLELGGPSSADVPGSIGRPLTYKMEPAAHFHHNQALLHVFLLYSSRYVMVIDTHVFLLLFQWDIFRAKLTQVIHYSPCTF